jgi:hypothetical protein
VADLPEKLVTIVALTRCVDPPCDDHMREARTVLAAVLTALPDCREVDAPDDGYGEGFVTGWEHCLAFLARMGDDRG